MAETTHLDHRCPECRFPMRIEVVTDEANGIQSVTIIAEADTTAALEDAAVDAMEREADRLMDVERERDDR